MDSRDYTEQMWQRGQQHLANLRYGAAVRYLEAAEGAAWRRADGVALARIYLPLLEARRLTRYQAAEGVVVICGAGTPELEERAVVKDFLGEKGPQAGTILLGAGREGRGRSGGIQRAMEHVGRIRETARRTGRSLESLLLMGHGDEVRMVSPGDAHFAGGLKVTWTQDANVLIGASTDPELQVPLPGPGKFFTGSALQPMVRESLIVGWEALALKWQHRHPPLKTGGVWEEMAWLRLALRIDPACEPVAMRIMALGEAAGRSKAR